MYAYAYVCVCVCVCVCECVCVCVYGGESGRERESLEEEASVEGMETGENTINNQQQTAMGENRKQNNNNSGGGEVQMRFSGDATA